MMLLPGYQGVSLSFATDFWKGKWSRAVAFALVMCGVISCGPGDRVEVTKSREASSFEPAYRLNVPAEVRLGLKKEGAAESGVGGGGSFADSMSWTVPEGWTELGAAMMRDINLSFGPNQEGECYFTAIRGQSGGVAANINRWRGQMGLEPLDQEALGKLELRPLLGMEGFFVDVTGDYKGFGQEEAKEGYRMLGVILELPGAALFVKLVGPESLVAENAEKFREFCNSLSIRAPEA